MNWGQLAEVIRGVAWKRLSPHEVDPSVSNGHEFQGVGRLRKLLGAEDRRFEATYMLLDDHDENIEVVHSWARWYDSRTGQAHRTPEWRLYYPAEAGAIQARMSPGDSLVLLATTDDRLICLLAPAGSTVETELTKLFGIQVGREEPLGLRLIGEDESIDFLAALLLDELGLPQPQPPATDDNARIAELAERLIAEYPEGLPAGVTISQLIQREFLDVSVLDDPDQAITRWIEAEAALFRTWEDALIASRIKGGFLTEQNTPDVEGFREFTMRIRQSRVSRAGGALQHHVARVLRDHRIRFDAQAKIDDGERPDFLIPGRYEYENLSWPASDLRMLAVKYTAKDRWRQVLAEAKRISPKHLLTLEGSVSDAQLRLMASASLILVVPKPLHREGIPGVMTVKEFLVDIPEVARARV